MAVRRNTAQHRCDTYDSAGQTPCELGLARRDVLGNLDGAKDLMASEVIRLPSLNIARQLPAPSR
jgi:hypothetical protein